MNGARSRGFTLIEIVIVMAIMGITLAFAMPRMQQWLDDQRLKSAARSIADALELGRAEAIRTGNVHLVFFMEERPGVALRETFVGQNPADPARPIVPIVILNDGRQGSAGQNCLIDVGEERRARRAEPGVAWGATFAAADRAPGDPIADGTPIGGGISLRDAAGNATTWVAFRPDGIPVAASAACVLGGTGSGAGAIYLSNGERDYAVVLSALGAVRVHAYERVAAAWRN